jgi:outer membrane usher protein
VGIGFDHYIDRGGETDSFFLRADYISPNYASLSDPDPFNTSSASFSGQYTRQFSRRLVGTLTGSYQMSRANRSDSYRIGGAAYYRLTERLSLRIGADYSHSGSEFGLGNGVGVNVGIVFQPDYRRRAEARYESRDNTAELSYSQSGLNELESVGFGGVVGHQDGSVRAQAYASYAANRFDASVSHSSFGPNLADFGQLNATTVRVGTTLAFADGMIGVGRRINDSFILLSPHPNLGKRSVVAGQSLAENNYIGRSGALGSALNNFLGSYVTQSVQYDVEAPPTGYDIGPGVVRVRPPYRSGYALRIGTDAFVSAMGTLMRADDKPVSLIGGRVTLLDVAEGESPKPIPFFTNSVGRFAIASLLPGRRYLVETYGPNGTIDRSFEFTVPGDTDGLVDLGTVQAGSVR